MGLCSLELEVEETDNKVGLGLAGTNGTGTAAGTDGRSSSSISSVGTKRDIRQHRVTATGN